MFLRNRHSLTVRLLVVLGAISAFVLAYQWGNTFQRMQVAPPPIAGLLIDPPLASPEFVLTDLRGRSFDRTALADGWTLLAFGDLRGASGQLAAQRLLDVVARAAAHRELRALRIALISPHTQDDPQTYDLGRDFMRLNPNLFILGGAPADFARLVQAWGASSADLPPALYAVGPGGYLAALLPGGQDNAQVVADLLLLREHGIQPPREATP